MNTTNLYFVFVLFCIMCYGFSVFPFSHFLFLIFFFFHLFFHFSSHWSAAWLLLLKSYTHLIWPACMRLSCINTCHILISPNINPCRSIVLKHYPGYIGVFWVYVSVAWPCCTWFTMVLHLLSLCTMPTYLTTPTSWFVAPSSLLCSPPPSCLDSSLVSQALPFHRDKHLSQGDGGMHSCGRSCLFKLPRLGGAESFKLLLCPRTNVIT